VSVMTPDLMLERVFDLQKEFPGKSSGRAAHAWPGWQPLKFALGPSWVCKGSGFRKASSLAVASQPVVCKFHLEGFMRMYGQTLKQVLQT
jgi:hypothetical protein